MFPVGIDVSKNTLDLCMLTSKITGIQLKIFFAGSGFNTAVRKMFMW